MMMRNFFRTGRVRFIVKQEQSNGRHSQQQNAHTGRRILVKDFNVRVIPVVAAYGGNNSRMSEINKRNTAKIYQRHRTKAQKEEAHAEHLQRFCTAAAGESLFVILW
jgi:hypothetical protein